MEWYLLPTQLRGRNVFETDSLFLPLGRTHRHSRTCKGAVGGPAHLLLAVQHFDIYLINNYKAIALRLMMAKTIGGLVGEGEISQDIQGVSAYVSQAWSWV